MRTVILTGFMVLTSSISAQTGYVMNSGEGKLIVIIFIVSVVADIVDFFSSEK